MHLIDLTRLAVIGGEMAPKTAPMGFGDLLRQKFKVWKFVRFGSKPAVCNTLK